MTRSRWLGRSPRPILVIWGEADETVPFDHATQLIELMPQAQLRSYPGMGHNITFAQAPLVSRLLTDFLAVQGTRVTSGGAAVEAARTACPHGSA